ncbi:MAG: DNA repair protein RecN [Bacteroidota bacterium]|nr:DNA repair protein RecN [Bacteroidota bacterium]
MLQNLSIQNYILIDKLSIDFSEGLTIITGETGAGKSILLGALSLILGQRADMGVLLDKNRKCIVEGNFNIKDYSLNDFFLSNELDYDDNTNIRREINPQGKSRAFINDTPVNLNILRDFILKLVDIHSQHQTLLLNESGFQLSVVDQYAQNHNILSEYKAHYKNLKSREDELKKIKEEDEKAKLDFDYISFLLNELAEANLTAGEQEELEERLQTLTHTEEIKTVLAKSCDMLSNNETNILDHLKEIDNGLNQLAGYFIKIKKLSDRLNICYIELKDITYELFNLNDNAGFDPSEVDEINTRLQLIYNLQKKHKVNSIADLLLIKDNLEIKVKTITSFDEKIELLNKDIIKYKNELSIIAEKISKNRLDAIPKIEKNIRELLVQLAIPDGILKIIHQQSAEFLADGTDKIKFHFSANKGMDMRELSKVASGGELSRLMLSIKSLISQKKLLPTLIFDEIDTGISGDVAARVGGILKMMSDNMQVIAITHSPQIAAKATNHFKVYKDSVGNVTKSAIKKLDEKERINEIAKMLSNDSLTDAALQNAIELMKN